MSKKLIAAILSMTLLLAVALGGCADSGGGDTSTGDAGAGAEGTGGAADGAGDSDSGADTVKIALCIPISGSSADAGRMARDGAELAVKRINEAGGIQSLGGAQIELVIADVTSDPAQSKNVVERVISGGDIVGVVGCGTSALTLPVLPVLEKQQIPIVTYSNSKELNNQGYEYVFSVSPTAVNVGNAQPEFIRWLNEEKGYNYTKVAIVYENSSNGISVAEGVRDSAEAMGLEIVYDESFQPGLADASSIVTAIMQSGAEVVIPTAYTNDNKLLCDTMRSMNYFPLMMGASSWQSFGDDMGDSANGFIATGNWNYRNRTVLDNPEYVAITEEFEATYGYPMAEQSGPAYVCVELICNALENTGSRDTVELRNAISGYSGQCMIQPGLLEFDEDGVTKHATVGVQQWQFGECVCVWPEELAGAAFIDPSEFN